MPFERNVCEVNKYEDSCVCEYWGLRKTRISHPCCRERHERHHEEVHKVYPNKTWGRLGKEPQQVVVIQPDDSNEVITHQVAQCSGPKRSKSCKGGMLGRLEFEHHDGDDDREHRIGKGS